MQQFSLDLHELEAVYALQSLSEVPETQLSTEEIMRKLSSADSEVTYRKVLGSDEVVPTRPGIDPLEVTVPMARSVEDWRSFASTRTPPIGILIPLQSPLAYYASS